MQSDTRDDGTADEQLMERYQQGNTAVLAILIERYVDAIYRYAYRFVRTAAATEDVVQETWIKVWKYGGRFKNGMAFKPWLYRIAHNTAIDYLRKKQPLALEEMAIEVADDTVELMEQSIAREESARLTAAIERLSEQYRAVILLRAEEQLTFEEIADVLGKPMNTVKSLYRRGLAILQKQLHQ